MRPSQMGVSGPRRIKDSPTYHLDPVGVAGEGFAGLTPLLHFRAGPHRNRAGLFYPGQEAQKETAPREGAVEPVRNWSE